MEVLSEDFYIYIIEGFLRSFFIFYKLILKPYITFKDFLKKIIILLQS